MNSNNNSVIPHILKDFAQLMGATIQGHRLTIPSKFGKGVCAGFAFNKHMQMLISDYELYEDITVRNATIDADRKTLFFKFQNIFLKDDSDLKNAMLRPAPSVLIGTSRINTDEIIAIHSNTSTINIEVGSDYLSGCLNQSTTSPIVQGLLQNSQPLLFEQLIYPSLKGIVDEIINTPQDAEFTLFFLKIKAEELICRLLMELHNRQTEKLQPLNSHDIRMIYRIKDQMLKHLNEPPSIKQLAADAGMSPTKLKRLFSQIFGNSVFNYYQEFRMKEAARLLKQEKLSVTETGYRLGFTNLSHFSRIFEEHIGIKPKKYSML